MRRALVGLLLAASLAGCPSDDTCDALCLANNGDSAASQSSYWQFPGLAGGNPPSGAAQIALFADRTGAMRWSGGPSGICLCPIGTSCAGTSIESRDFSFSVTGPGTLLIGGGGLVFQCTAPAMGSVTMTSITNMTGGISTATLEIDVSFGGALQHHTGALISGTF